MTIAALDKEIKDIISKHHVVGAEAVLSALVRACKGEPYLEPDVIRHILDHVIKREEEGIMELHERRYYEAALILCLGFKEEGADTLSAIEKTIEVLVDIVLDVNDLRNYLTSFIY